MFKWFTIEKIDDQTFGILERKHRLRANSFLLIGRDRALLIDSGLGIGDIREPVSYLTDLPVIHAVTHMHWDHIGGHQYFQAFGAPELEKDWLREDFPLALPSIQSMVRRWAIQLPPGYDPKRFEVVPSDPTFTYIGGETIELGGREVKIIATPGHTVGHTAFYEPDRCYLYAGDLLYPGTISIFMPETGPMAFYDSIRKVSQLKVERLLPGHFTLNLDSSIIGRVRLATELLKDQGKLKMGAGTFKFKTFSIHLASDEQSAVKEELEKHKRRKAKKHHKS